MPAHRGRPPQNPTDFVSVTNKFDEAFWQEMNRYAKQNGIPSVPFYISFVMHQHIAAMRAKEVRDRKAGRADV
jgi:hypothetical protein